MRFVILTGMSGAGKSQALHKMEDAGYFCIDNLPPALIPAFTGFCLKNKAMIENAAIVVDSRSGDALKDMSAALDELRGNNLRFEIFFLDASDDTLIRRYKSTRRIHPMAKDSSLEEGIKKERKALGMLRDIANHVMDTSTFDANQLNQAIEQYFGDLRDDDATLISVSSFGYKRGIPLDADLVFDVRFLPNPFYVDSLKTFSGKNELVKKYVMDFPQTEIFLDKVLDMVEFLAPLYKHQSKNQLMIAIGCTGGMHRSVVIAEVLFKRLKLKGYRVVIGHRDIGLEYIEQ